MRGPWAAGASTGQGGTLHGRRANYRLCQTEIIDIDPGQSLQVEPNVPVCQMIVSVAEGGVSVFVGGFSGNQPRVPHYHFGQTGRPEAVDIPEGDFRYTFLAVGPVDPGETVRASVSFWGP